MINKWLITEPKGKRKGCVIALPGRAVPGEMMDKFANHFGLSDSMIVVLEPDMLRWYPQPNGPADQVDAVAGLAEAVRVVNQKIGTIQRAFHLKRRQIVVAGYSAGAVLALQLLAASHQPFAAVVSFGGAILEPDKMPKAPTQTPVLLRHAIDDDCFKWDERYLPMKQALIENDYNLFVSEKPDGGHGIYRQDATAIGRFCAPHLGYKDFIEPEDD